MVGRDYHRTTELVASLKPVGALAQGAGRHRQPARDKDLGPLLGRFAMLEDRGESHLRLRFSA